MNLSSKAIVESLVASAIWATLALIVTVAYKYRDNISVLQALVLLIHLVVLALLLWYRHKFKTITGIESVERLLGKGTKPIDALKLCKNNFKFLGIAANKFVFAPEFEDAVKRCNRSGDPIRILLSSPNNPIIKQMARRAKRDENEFRDMIIRNLRKLKTLKDENGYNLEVRLYKSEGDSGPPSFRLFFIDNTCVLVSYYVMGDGDGSDMPQIRVVRPKKARDTENFYFAFDHYFNSLWANSEEYSFDEDGNRE